MYGLKEKNLAKAYIKLIPLGRHDPDAVRLLNWKKPTDKYVRVVGPDFPPHRLITLFHVPMVRKRPATSPRCSTKSSTNALLWLRDH